MDMTLTPEITTLLNDPVMMIFSSETASDWPTIGRGLGARIVDDITFELLFSANRYPDMAAALTIGARMAITITRVSDYVSYQIKGDAMATNADSADELLAAAYRRAITSVFRDAGVRPDVIEQWIGGTELIKATLRVRELYEQTPGPRAGLAIGRPS